MDKYAVHDPISDVFCPVDIFSAFTLKLYNEKSLNSKKSIMSNKHQIFRKYLETSMPKFQYIKFGFSLKLCKSKIKI